MELVTKKRLHLVLGPGATCRWPRRSPTASACTLGEANLAEFANGELHCRFGESIRGADVFIIQSHSHLDGLSVNDAIMEQLIMVDAAKRASAKRITVVCPYYGYARQDRKAEGREPITRQARGRHVPGRRGQAPGQRRPALRPDPGLLRRPGRPPHRHAGAGRLHGAPTAATTSSSCRPTPAG